MRAINQIYLSNFLNTFPFPKSKHIQVSTAKAEFGFINSI